MMAVSQFSKNISTSFRLADLHHQSGEQYKGVVDRKGTSATHPVEKKQDFQAEIRSLRHLAGKDEL